MRSSRRHFLQQASLMAFLAATFGPDAFYARNKTKILSESPLKLIVDADTANEVDDLFAIAIALLEPNLKIIGITSAQWHTAKHGSRDKVAESQELNEAILRLMGKMDIPHPIGSNFPMVKTHRPQPSDAATFIIEQALAMPEGEKINVAILGPATNLASAILIEPRIIPKIVANYLGFWYHPDMTTWNKREFNTNNDPNAVDLLLNTAGLEFRVMTASTSQHLIFDKSEVDQHLKGKGGIGDYLVERWESFDRTWQKTDKEKRHWVMWDIALIQALATPKLATLTQVQTPHDNLDRQIHAYTKIDVTTMKQRYWEIFDEYLEE